MIEEAIVDAHSFEQMRTAALSTSLPFGGGGGGGGGSERATRPIDRGGRDQEAEAGSGWEADSGPWPWAAAASEQPSAEQWGGSAWGARGDADGPAGPIGTDQAQAGQWSGAGGADDPPWPMSTGQPDRGVWPMGTRMAKRTPVGQRHWVPPPAEAYYRRLGPGHGDPDAILAQMRRLFPNALPSGLIPYLILNAVSP